MVGPISDEERRAGRQRLGAGFVFLVAVSAALMAAYGGATPFETGLVTAVGLIVGVGFLVAMGVWP